MVISCCSLSVRRLPSQKPLLHLGGHHHLLAVACHEVPAFGHCLVHLRRGNTSQKFVLDQNTATASADLQTSALFMLNHGPKRLSPFITFKRTLLLIGKREACEHREARDQDGRPKRTQFTSRLQANSGHGERPTLDLGCATPTRESRKYESPKTLFHFQGSPA